ncbi:hypothetical protein TRFO_19898 [Tritrichomonas foetus]|uniref:Uncharacterized protein n=1 Tax=Tritrichomonas foetus TaxID=1144522 RepID=A0A1J4KHC6_9EUKA|nr:hypothetical protein TRFO_19898 [Tritrichomonas foetus]|eukprot:OHT10761.1 hypothetical protein TRFO_19898 [Tritrichomonas foetus]
MSDSDLSGSESDNEQTQQRSIISNTKKLELSDDDEINHPAKNISKSPQNSDSDTEDRRQNLVNDDNFVENDDGNNSEHYTEEEEKREKKKGRRRKEKLTGGDDPDSIVDKETQELVKSITKGRSVQYMKNEKDDAEWEEEARQVLSKIKEAIDQDITSYQNGKMPFARIRYLKELKVKLQNPKLTKMLLNNHLLQFFAAMISPYPLREGQTEPDYPNKGLRTDVVKILLQLPVKEKHFEDTANNEGTIISVLQDMPTIEGEELQSLISQVLSKFLRIVTHADDNEGDQTSLTIDKKEAYELKASTRFEYSGKNTSKNERRLEKKAKEFRRSTGADRPRDYVPQPRLINKNIKAAKKKLFRE